MNNRAAYHAARHKALSADPAYRKMLAERAAAWRARNPAASKMQNARRRAADPDKARRETREWFALNPGKRAAYEQNRRAKKRAMRGRLSPNIRAKLMTLQRGKCAVCRATLAAPHMDHIMPLALGGAHADTNMQLLCQPCNQQKHAKHPADFMRDKGFLL